MLVRYQIETRYYLLKWAKRQMKGLEVHIAKYIAIYLFIDTQTFK